MPQQPLTLKTPIVLVGMMGAGKTAIGGAVARKLDVPFLDSDEALEAAANSSIAEIFERDGEAFFRARETEVIARLLDGAPSVLSTGGGAFLAQATRSLIDTKAAAIWLKADLALLWERVRHKTTRPLLRTSDPYATLKAIYEARTPVYAKAHIVVEADAKYSIDDMAGQVVAKLAAADLLKEA